MSCMKLYRACKIKLVLNLKYVLNSLKQMNQLKLKNKNVKKIIYHRYCVCFVLHMFFKSYFKNMLLFIQEARDDMYAMNPEYEQLRELGRQLQQADNIKGGNATGSLRQVNEAWDQVQSLLADKHQTYSGVANLWHQYNENKQNVGRVLEDVDPQVQQEMAFTLPDDVKKALDQHKVIHNV